MQIPGYPTDFLPGIRCHLPFLSPLMPKKRHQEFLILAESLLSISRMSCSGLCDKSGNFLSPAHPQWSFLAMISVGLTGASCGSVFPGISQPALSHPAMERGTEQRALYNFLSAHLELFFQAQHECFRGRRRPGHSRIVVLNEIPVSPRAGSPGSH